MPSKQTRRSISVRGTTYETLRRYCDSTERSMSDIVEEQLARLFDLRGKKAAPAPAKAHKPAPRGRTVANRLVRAHAPVGRPAPVNANAIIQARVRAPKGDYRIIRF